MSINHIIDNLYLGCFKSAEDGTQLSKNNIKYIFNITTECNNNINLINNHSIFCHKYNIRDDCDITIDILNNIYNQYNNIENLDGNVLIHCAHGRSRSVCVVLFILMKRFNYSLDYALKYLYNKRPVITPSFNYIKLLSQLDNSFDIQWYYLSNIREMIPNKISDIEVRNLIQKYGNDSNKIVNEIINSNNS